MGAYYTRIQTLGATAIFTTPKAKLLQIIHDCSFHRIRRKALQENCTLKQLLNEARAVEIINARAVEINKENLASAMTSQVRSS